MAYLDMMNNPLFSTTVTGVASGEVNTLTYDNAFNSGTSIAAGDLSSDTENMDMSWPSFFHSQLIRLIPPLQIYPI